MLTRYGQHALTWVDSVSPTPAEMKPLMKEFELDPLIAEELLVPSYKPKVERRGNALYIILHFPAFRLAGTRSEQEIDFVVGKNFLITTRYEAVNPLHAFARSFEADSVLGRGTATHGGHLFVSLARSLYTALNEECHALNRRLQDIEQRIFTGEERTMVIELSQTGRIIHDFRQALLSHREMLLSLEPVGARMFGPEFSYWVRDLLSVYERVERNVENLREALHELRATNDSLLNTKQNEIMKNLTVIAFVFLPLTFIAGLFQMNTRYTPLVGTPGDFWIIIAGMVVLAVGSVMYFKHKDWI